MLPTGAPKPPGPRGIPPRRSPGGWSPVSNGGGNGGFNNGNNGGNGSGSSGAGGRFARLLCLLALLALAALGGAAVGRRTASSGSIDRVVGKVHHGEEAAKAMASSAKAALLKSKSKPMSSAAVDEKKTSTSSSSSSSSTEVNHHKGLLAPASSLPKVFLFIGILSGRGYRHRRLAVREAWSAGCNHPPAVVSKFVLSADEATPQVAREETEFGDIIYIKERTNYKSILYKTYFIFEYAVEHYDVAFVLKTDDDAFVNVPPLLRLLGSLCETRDCSAERLYIGRMIQESEVLLAPGHKWNNAVFYNHTGVRKLKVFDFFFLLFFFENLDDGNKISTKSKNLPFFFKSPKPTFNQQLRTYPKYAMGGGYVLSGDVARTLVGVNRAMKLKFTPIEDATLGFWLMAMDLRHVDHERFYTWAASCCFETLEHDKDKDINGEQQPTKVKVMDAVVDDLCTDDPWLVLHKIDSPTKMRALGDEARKCGPTPPLESIARAGGGQPWRPPGRSGGGGSGSGNGGGNGGGGSAAEVESTVERGTGVDAGGSLSDEREDEPGAAAEEERKEEASSVADSAAAAADAAAADAAAAVKEEAEKAAAAAVGDGGGGR